MMENEIIQKFSDNLSLSKERVPDITLCPYNFLGYGIHKSECKVEIWKEGDKAIIMFTDTDKGTSVTNAAEQLITEIYNKYLMGFDKSNCLFIETYDKKEAIDVVVPRWEGEKAVGVSWLHMGKISKNT